MEFKYDRYSRDRERRHTQICSIVMSLNDILKNIYNAKIKLMEVKKLHMNL